MKHNDIVAARATLLIKIYKMDMLIEPVYLTTFI